MGNPNDWNKTLIEEFRANGGKVGGYFTAVTVLLLHTQGAKSQQPRVNPLVYLTDGDRFVIAASKRGAPTNPDWYYNTVAQPLVTPDVGTEKLQTRAMIAEEPEQTRLYDRMAAAMPNYAEYQHSTTRTIPVIILTRVE
jgi:deazaflavin-dependent oxidoreductase (nitroreductase family)